ncbi:SMC-Scp complex subunit ScpB [Candidatus Bathyarchaeota archaeon]|nr:SMC-Scp complex subunit ScpB [Candidatus Bathyarchaeota archaeon]
MQKAEKRIVDLAESLSEKPAVEKMRRDFALLEAALYVAGRPLDLNELCSILKTRSKNKTKKCVKMLMTEYANRNTALEILELKDERYVLQLKAEYTPLVKRLVNRPLLSTGPLKTLSYIAFRQPISQKRVVDVRGHHVYGHIRVLKEMGLIAAERSGRSLVLRTTEYFADYFGLSHEMATMKKELTHVFEDSAKQEKPNP